MFYLAWVSDALVAVAGLNIDPYAAEKSIGRVRHVYALPAFRRQGIGQALLEEIERAAKPSFRMLRLRTGTPDGDRFYRAMGFERDPSSRDATHILNL